MADDGSVEHIFGYVLEIKTTNCSENASCIKSKIPEQNIP
jgi:hypothetical protein